jgi:lipid A 3-O-deacylase
MFFRQSAYFVAGFLGLLFTVSGDGLSAERVEDPDEDRNKQSGIFGMQVENDLFGGGEDRHYTHGLRFSWFSPAGDVPDWLEKGASYVPVFAHEGTLRYGYELGQAMFTPDDITIERVQPGQRPWAGYLYAGAGLLSDTGQRVDTLSFQVGIVGPYAYGRESQKFVHELIDSPEPMGWDHQLKTEPGIVITYERKWRGFLEVPILGLQTDATPTAGAALGNVYTYGALGMTFRIGQDLPHDYGPPRIRPSLVGSDYFEPVPGGVGWYLFGGVEGRVIGRNIFLDGNTFADSYSVDKKYFVGDVQFGAALIVDRYRLSYTQIFRTKEYNGQTDPDSFGSINLSIVF